MPFGSSKLPGAGSILPYLYVYFVVLDRMASSATALLAAFFPCYPARIAPADDMDSSALPAWWKKAAATAGAAAAVAIVVKSLQKEGGSSSKGGGGSHAVDNSKLKARNMQTGIV